VRIRAIRSIVVLGLLLGLGGLAACSAPSVEYSESNGSYTNSQTRLILERIDTSRFAKKPTSEASALRSKALAQLRSQGASAAVAADLITETFPPGTRSVPVYVEKAVVEGTPSYVVIEAWGPTDGKLDRKRLWVIASETGDIIFSAAAR